ncbi:Asp23/Gls24 family envelope stress response protein [Streptomyces sp. YIM S03343]
MTVTTGGAARPRRRSPLIPPGDRGATRIADRVVVKVAAQAAREVLGPLPPEAGPPHAEVVVHQDTARVRLHLELEYPCDIGARSAAVRRHVAQRVGALVGMEVAEVAVQVERLHLVPEHGVAQGRTR